MIIINLELWKYDHFLYIVCTLALHPSFFDGWREKWPLLSYTWTTWSALFAACKVFINITQFLLHIDMWREFRYKNTASSRLVEKISPCTVEEFEPVLFIICYPTVKALRNPSVNRLTSLVGIGVNLYWSKGSTGPQILATWDLAWPSPPFWHEKQKNTDIFSLSFNTLTRQSGLESSV